MRIGEKEGRKDKFIELMDEKERKREGRTANIQTESKKKPYSVLNDICVNNF